MSSWFWNSGTRWAATKLNRITSFVPPPPPEADSPKRKLLLVHAPPQPGSFSAAIAAAVEEGARAGGHECRKLSLYEQGYGVALTAAERSRYFDTTEPERLSKDVRGALQDLSWCDSVVFVYPTWWFNVPAALKGFFDRTFQPGSAAAGALGAWEFPPASGDGGSSTGCGARLSPLAAAKVALTRALAPMPRRLKPLLTNVKRVAGVSTYGATQQITFLAGDNGRNTISTAIRHGVFAPECTCLWLGMYSMDFSSEGERKAFLERVRETFKSEF